VARTSEGSAAAGAADSGTSRDAGSRLSSGKGYGAGAGVGKGDESGSSSGNTAFLQRLAAARANAMHTVGSPGSGSTGGGGGGGGGDGGVSASPIVGRRGMDVSGRGSGAGVGAMATHGHG